MKSYSARQQMPNFWNCKVHNRVH